MAFRHLAIASAVALAALYAALILSLFTLYEPGNFFKPGGFFSALLHPRTLFSLRLSLVAGTLATLLSLALAFPAAYALSRCPFPGRVLVDTLLEVPVVVSPVALGAMLLLFFTAGPGAVLERHGMRVPLEVSGVVVAQFAATAGMTTRLLKAVLDEIPSRYEEVARSLGASPFRAYLTVILPLSLRGAVAAAILTWAKAVGEFGATITLAGAMAFKTETLPTAIFMALSSADLTLTATLILILVGVGLLTLYSVRLLAGRQRGRG